MIKAFSYGYLMYSPEHNDQQTCSNSQEDSCDKICRVEVQVTVSCNTNCRRESPDGIFVVFFNECNNDCRKW